MRPRFGVLAGYMVKQNLFLLFMCLAVGIGIYLLIDTFDRLDDFLEAGLGAETILYYFAVKLPVIVSQILPAVFLLSVVVQLCIMARNRELTALRAGGVSPAWFFWFFLFYGILWSMLQFGFSQYIGMFGQMEAHRVWKEDVRDRQIDELKVGNVWFRDGTFIVHAEEAWPSRSRASDVTVYELAPDTQRLIRIITASKALVDENGWGLLEVQELDVRNYDTEQRKSQFLSVRQNLRSFVVADKSGDKSRLPIWQLGEVIRELQNSGSNVESLQTAWHARFSYAFAIMTMALLGLAVTTFTEKPHIGVALSLLCIFIFYGVYMVGQAAGQEGILPPVMGAWLANAVFFALTTLRLAWVSDRRVRRYIARKVLGRGRGRV
ncbi:LptF/LptG family permease [Desulfovibrio oxyclinae]|uniref:LptF/LptG family permease n=1 Tax=Desulfovibrio oxyclinae TaxID=63560 RepID=UPI00036482F3|nr:LptF/LptG family permease [Desulfovibrio oxyclinae]